MKITVSNQLRAENPSPELEAWCRKNLVVDNPEYGKKLLHIVAVLHIEVVKAKGFEEIALRHAL